LFVCCLLVCLLVPFLNVKPQECLTKHPPKEVRTTRGLPSA
jgi:hypothetical protein